MDSKSIVQKSIIDASGLVREEVSVKNTKL